MTNPGFPQYPQSYPQHPAGPMWGPPPDPGPIPLRPLGVGDILGAAFGVVRRHFMALAPFAVIISAVASAVSVTILTKYDAVDAYVTAAWFDDVIAGDRTSIPTAVSSSAAASLVITVVGVMALAGVATAAAGTDATGHHRRRGSVRARMAGRTAALLLAAGLVGVGVSLGLAFFIVPGIFIFLIYFAAIPATVMESVPLATALKRSSLLTRGSRGRLFGVVLLMLVIAYAIELVVSSAALTVAVDTSSLGSLIIADAAGAVVSAITLSWTAAVIAVLYIDLRVRSENLAPRLRAFAQRRAADGGQPGTR